MARASRLRVRLRRAAITAVSRTHLALYRASRGRILGSVAGMPVLLLTTTGRRSRKPRTTPLTFFRHGDDLVVIGSNGGADRAPDWLLNLREHPRAVVPIGEARLPVTARLQRRSSASVCGLDHRHMQGAPPTRNGRRARSRWCCSRERRTGPLVTMGSAVSCASVRSWPFSRSQGATTSSATDGAAAPALLLDGRHGYVSSRLLAAGHLRR
jgi:deazaflavin-dependent oxidoreductase (nitroreductase family)